MFFLVIKRSLDSWSFRSWINGKRESKNGQSPQNKWGNGKDFHLVSSKDFSAKQVFRAKETPIATMATGDAKITHLYYSFGSTPILQVVFGIQVRKTLQNDTANKHSWCVCLQQPKFKYIENTFEHMGT